MKGRLYSVMFVFILSVLILSGCCPFPGPFDLIRREVSISGSGVVVGAEWSITGFEKVDVSHAFTVDIRQGDTFRVATSVDENVADYLQVVKQGDTVRIGLKPGTMVTNATLQAEVTMPELTGLDVSGASHVAIAGFKSPKALNVDVSGASSLRGDIEAGDARFDVSGASHVTLSGSGQDANIDASGASEADLAGFAVADAVVEASGASNVTVNASGRLDVDASGASHVYYLGSPALGTIDSSGGSSVQSR